jgi:TolB protein
LEIDGRTLSRLTNDPAADYYPEWTPDGVDIVFTSEMGGSADLYIARSDGSNMRQITDDTVDNYGPTWCCSNFVRP